MSCFDEVELAATPHDEPCAQVGEEGYGVKARAECLAYRAQLRRVALAAGREVPEGARLVVKSNAHDFGSYHEVAVRFRADDEAACDFAYWLESSQPEKWDAEARAELGLLNVDDDVVCTECEKLWLTHDKAQRDACITSADRAIIRGV